MTQEEMAVKLKGMITPHRYTHSLGVRDTAVKLARLYGADEEVCSVAGLIHDCAKSLSPEEQMGAIKRGNIFLFDGEDKVPEVLHAPAGVVIAKEEFGITDENILTAIRYHSIGNEQMSLTEAIIFVADYIEPNRKMHEGLPEVREESEKDIFAAVEKARCNTIAYCVKMGYPAFIFSKTSQSDS